MTKRLVEEGTEAWNSISQNSARVPWQSMLLEIEERFMKISGCGSRSLSHQVQTCLGDLSFVGLIWWGLVDRTLSF